MRGNSPCWRAKGTENENAHTIRQLGRCDPLAVQGTVGKARLQIRFAYNDAPGTWKLVVREVTTGRTAEGLFEMKQAARGEYIRRGTGFQPVSKACGRRQKGCNRTLTCHTQEVYGLV